MITAQNISKNFGSIQAVRNLSFHVPEGEILGLLGPNGAGKTTTMRILTCFMPPSSGDAVLAGYNILENPFHVKRQIGYMPENPPVYPEMKVSSFLRFVAEIKEVPKNKINANVEEAMEKVHIHDIRGRIIGHLSRGYRQRVGLAQALVHQPKVLILDEPTLGLDPQQIIEIRNLIRSLAHKHTIVLSSHILPEVQAVCTQVAIINHGKILSNDSLKNLTQGQYLRVSFKDDSDKVALMQEIRRIEGVTEVKEREESAVGIHFKIFFEKNSDDISEQIYKLSIDKNNVLLRIHPVRTSLEDIFLQTISGEYQHE